LLGSSSKIPHDISDVSYSIEVDFEFLDLPVYFLVPGDLGISIVDQVAGSIIHLQGHYLSLLHQVF
jgi:hypothetical protein